MKGWKIFWGLAFVILAVLLVLDATGVLAPIKMAAGDVTFWQILGGACVLYAAIHLIISKHIWMSIIFFGFLFMIFEGNIVFVLGMSSSNIINNWLLFGCTVLLSIGLSMIFPIGKRKRRERKKCRAGFNCQAKKNNLSDSEIYIDCATFREEHIENDLGSLEVRFENVDEYVSGGVLNIKNDLGSVEIYVPRAWKIESDISNSLGSVDIEDNVKLSNDAPVIKIIGSNSLGSIDIERV